MKGNTACYVNAAGREDLQSEIAGLACQDRDQQIDRGPAQFARIVRVESCIDDRFGVVFGQGDRFRHFRTLRYLLSVAKELVDVGSAHARTDTFHPNMSE